VGGDQNDLIRISKALGPAGFRMLAANSAEAGMDVLAKQAFDIVLCDQRLASMSGADFLAAVRRLYPRVTRILSSGKLDSAALTDAINAARIHKFVSKDWDAKRLRAEVRAAYRGRRKPV
jgi:response regulator RpfG family c-di-GMP phosphodiesterase